MTAVISMLRGVNVGGHHKIKMEALRALYASIGLKNAQTFIQSGNVIFGTIERDMAKLSREIEDAIERMFLFRPSVILRTASEFRDVIASNPFAGRTDVEDGKLVVNFLASHPGSEACEAVRGIETRPEELHVAERELYIYFPNGQGKSKLPAVAIERALKTPGTARNWNSVRKILEIAEKMEAAFPA